jgi:hypothetical protein
VSIRLPVIVFRPTARPTRIPVSISSGSARTIPVMRTGPKSAMAVVYGVFDENDGAAIRVVVYVSTTPESGRGSSRSSIDPQCGQLRRGGSDPWPFSHAR